MWMTCPRPYLTWTISTNLFSCLYKVNTYYDLKQKSSEYLQSTLVFTKEREEVEKIAAAEAQREAEKTIPPLSRNASNESTYQPFRQGFRPMDIFFTTYRNFFITGVSQLLQRFD